MLHPYLVKRSRSLDGGPRLAPWTGGNNGVTTPSMLRQCLRKPSREPGFLSPSWGGEAPLPGPPSSPFTGGHQEFEGPTPSGGNEWLPTSPP